MQSIYARIYMNSYDTIVSEIQNQTSIKDWWIGLLFGSPRKGSLTIVVGRLQTLVGPEKSPIVVSILLERGNVLENWRVADISLVRNSGRIAASHALTGRNLQTKIRELSNQAL